MPSINLAPGTQYLIEERKRRRRITLLIVGIVIIVVSLTSGLWAYQKTLEERETGVDGRIRNVELEISKLDESVRRVVLFEERLAALDGLLDDHVTWNRFLGDLERLLPVETHVNKISINGRSGTAELGGETSDVDRVATTLASLVASPGRESIFTAAKLKNVQRKEEATPDALSALVTYTFFIDLTFDPHAIVSGS